MSYETDVIEPDIDEVSSNQDTGLEYDPVQVFHTLSSICTEARSSFTDTKSAFDLYPAFFAHLQDIIRNDSLPRVIREDVERISLGLRGRLGRLAQQPTTSSSDIRALQILKEVKQATKVRPFVLGQSSVQPLPPVPIASVMGLADFVQQELAFSHYQSGYKGGASRYAAKMYHYHLACQGRRPGLQIGKQEVDSMMEAELPMDDFDIVLAENQPSPQMLAAIMNADPDGIEYVPGFSVSALGPFYATRDMTSNQSVVTSDMLFTTENALDALDRGQALPVLNCAPSIFGRKIFMINERIYYSAANIYRMIKSVCEGKHLYFEGHQYNFDDVGMGRYDLVLIRKWLHKPNCGELMAKAHSCALQMGVTMHQRPLDYWLEKINTYPDFDYMTQPTAIKVARWIMGKLVTYIEKKLRAHHGLHSGENHFTSTNESLVQVDPRYSMHTPDDVAQLNGLIDELRTHKTNSVVTGSYYLEASRWLDAEATPTWRDAVESLVSRNMTNNRSLDA